MAGLIVLDEKHVWSVAGWVFNHVLRLTRDCLRGKDSAEILKRMDETGQGREYLSLESLTPAERASFRSALEAAYEKAKADGSESFADPAFYLGFIERFEELLELIKEYS